MTSTSDSTRAGLRAASASATAHPNVDRDDVGPGDAQHRERAVEVIGLRRDAVVRIERPVRLAPSEQVERERRHAAKRKRRRNVAPEESRGGEPVEQHDGPVPESVSLDVNRARSDRNPHACNLSSCDVDR